MARRFPTGKRNPASKRPKRGSVLKELRRLTKAQVAQIDSLSAKVEKLSASADAYAALLNQLAEIETRVRELRLGQIGDSRSSKRIGPNLNASIERIDSRRPLSWDDYRLLVAAVRTAVLGATPPRAGILVVSRGDPQLLGIRGRTASHFPQAADGQYAGHHPADSSAAIAHLESLASKGKQFLVFPRTAFWWLEHYAAFREYLKRHHRSVLHDDHCIIFQLLKVVPADGHARSTPGHAGSGPAGLGSTDGEGFNPYPIFDPDWYQKQYPQVKQSGLEPLEHYLVRGVNAGFSPHPLFDSTYYRKAYPESRHYNDPLMHYLTEGWKRGCKPSPNFDPRFYLANYPDVAAAGMEPLTHYILAGHGEGRFGSAPDNVRLESFKSDYIIPIEPAFRQPPPALRAKAIAFYLPQFHPIPENDLWWGKGFTEWTNVRRGKPQFDGHYQPHVPLNRDYYDLRDPKTLQKQALLARRNGIHGFCYYYYWFHGKVLLDLPIRRILETREPDFPFCICWANENWTRRWDGLEKEVLISQNHSAEDDLAFIRRIEPILLHENYIRVEEKPLLLVYRPSLLPNASETAARWRDYFRSRGHGDLYLAATRTFNHSAPPSDFGFDAAIQFPPHVATVPVTYLMPGISPSFEGRVFDYTQAKEKHLDELRRAPESQRLYPGVMPSWDNTPRRQHRSHVWTNTSPESYHDWLSRAVDHLQNQDADHRLVFINGWNEWAEGCHLEPDIKYGHAWLNATRMALQPSVPVRNNAKKGQRFRTPAASILTPARATHRIPPQPVPTRPGTSVVPQATPDYYRLKTIPAKTAGRKLSARTRLKGRVAVHIHAYFLDVLPKLLSRLEMIPTQYDLLVSTDSASKSRQLRRILGKSGERRSSLQIEICPNRGRDVSPMVSTFGRQLLNHTCALHIHTKKCEYDEAHGSAWLDHNLDHLLHSPAYVAAALDIFERDDSQGILLPAPYPGIASWMHWGENRAMALQLLERLRIPEDSLKSMPLYFPASMMFWFKPLALQQLLASNISFDDFPPEPIHYDGTLAHAIERSILYIAKYNGYSYTTIAPKVANRPLRNGVARTGTAKRVPLLSWRG
jgi:lipopolysaccharide biosynthesis protein